MASEGTKSGAFCGHAAGTGRSGAGANFARPGDMAHTSPASKIRHSATSPMELRGFSDEVTGAGVLFEFDSREDIGSD